MPKCKIMMKSGSRSGKKCGKECVKGKTKCSYHNRSKSTERKEKRKKSYDSESESENDNSCTDCSDSEDETWDIRDFIEMCKDFKYENPRDKEFNRFLNRVIKDAKKL